jgi:diguanylate cyclase (GGDEF)-like protein/PAS domain S-box-containing protein
MDAEMDQGTETLTRLLETVFQHSPVPIYVHTTEGQWLFANDECCRALGVTPAELRPGTSIRSTLPASTAEGFLNNDREVIESGESSQFTEEVLDQATGEVRTYVSVKFPVRGAEEEVIGVGGISFDVTDYQRQQRELVSAQAMVATVFEATRLGIYVQRSDENGLPTGIVECNAAFCAITGYQRSDLIGASVASLMHPDDTVARERLVDELRTGHHPVGELRYRSADGGYVWCMVVPAITFGPDGEQLFVVQVLDITERREFERQLRHHADHDSLTGLLSRRRFTEMLSMEANRAQTTRKDSSLLLLDLDGFKDVNDALGHSTGDALLRRMATALNRSLRGGDLVARIGGDEFAVLLPETDAEAAIEVAEKLVAAVHGNGRVTTDAGHIAVTASVGITSWDATVAVDAEQLLAEADIAMYDAKAAGRNRAALFERGRQRHVEIANRGNRLTELRDAVTNERFVLHAQPIIPLLADAAEAGVEHYELLVRMRRPDGTLAMPAEFLPEAERHGLMDEIDKRVLAEAVRILKLRRLAGKTISASVNLCADTLEDVGLGERIASLLESSGVPPELLTLELTETGALSDLGRASELSTELRSIGCKFALDDFGSAFASLQYLKHIHFDLVKIDGEFVRNLPRSPADQLIVKAVAEMAHGFGAKVVAEFVDGQETVELLRAFGVEYGQGYFLGRPEPLPLS